MRSPPDAAGAPEPPPAAREPPAAERMAAPSRASAATQAEARPGAHLPAATPFAAAAPPAPEVIQPAPPARAGIESAPPAAAAPRAEADGETRYIAVAAQRDAAGTVKLPEDLVPVVRQQLDTLTSQQLLWRGELWPGQPLDWEIEEHAQRARSEDPHAPSWTSELRLSLPRLGSIKACLGLAGNRIVIRLAAADLASAHALSAASDELSAALDASGIGVDALQVRHDAGS
jgi:hypothetical protein